MSAPDKERQPIITTTGKRGYIRICVRCGKTLVGVGQRTKYCPECRAEVYREAAMDYKALNPEKVQAAYERRQAAKRLPVYCQRCGCEITKTTRRQKWCPDCKKAVKAQQSAESWKRRSEICRNAQGQIVCKRCGKVIENRNGRQLYCTDCRVEVDKELKAARYERQKMAQKEAGTDAEPRKHVKKSPYAAGEDRLKLLTRVADWQGLTYGQLMTKPQGERETLILTYKALHHVP